EHPGPGPLLAGVARRARVDLHTAPGGEVPPRPRADVLRRRVLAQPDPGPEVSERRRGSLLEHRGRPGVPRGPRAHGERAPGARPLHGAGDATRGLDAF